MVESPARHHRRGAAGARARRRGLARSARWWCAPRARERLSWGLGRSPGRRGGAQPGLDLPAPWLSHTAELLLTRRMRARNMSPQTSLPASASCTSIRGTAPLIALRRVQLAPQPLLATVHTIARPATSITTVGPTLAACPAREDALPTSTDTHTRIRTYASASESQVSSTSSSCVRVGTPRTTCTTTST